MKRASTLGFCAISIFLIATPFLRAQDKTRTLEFGAYRRYDISTEPVAIVKKEIGNKIFRESPGESKVMAGSDWLHELTLTFKNISSKSIQAFEAHLIVPKQGNMSEIGTVVLRFPFESILDPDSKTSNQMLKVWKSGQVISMKIPVSKLRLLDNLRTKGVYDIDTVSIAIYRIEFDDRTGWFQGMKTHENPDLPGNWIPDRPMTSSNSEFKWNIFVDLINSVGPPLSEFIWLSPALGGISFIKRNNSTRTEEIAGCGWYVQDFQGTCGLLPGSGSCPNDNSFTCKYILQDILSNQALKW